MRFAPIAFSSALLAAASTFALPFAAEPLVPEMPQLLSRQAAFNTSQQEPAYTPDVPIHRSCNGTQRAQIQAGLEDMKRLATEARSHILHYGTESELFVRYFGADGDPAPVVGYLSALIEGDKTGTLIRCDDPDGNCALFQDYYAGHWRGENATQETVICDLTYKTRRRLTQVCALGFELANTNPNLIFGADLMHRLFHVPKVSNEKINHVADPYADCLDLAKTAPEHAVANQHTIQYFALDVWANLMTPGGCVGDIPAPETESSSTSSASASTSTSTSTSAAASSATTSGKDCHTHADGTLHCE